MTNKLIVNIKPLELDLEPTCLNLDFYKLEVDVEPIELEPLKVDMDYEVLEINLKPITIDLSRIRQIEKEVRE